MTREEAIKLVKRIKGAMVYTEEEKKALETLIPELRESDDERIRRKLFAILEWAKCYGDCGFTPDEVKEIITYLEKQKEQNPTTKVNGEPVPTENHSVNIPLAEWSEEDKKIVETICKEGDLKPSEKRWLKSLPERFNLQLKQEWSEEDEALFELLHQCVCRCINDDRMDYSERDKISKTMIPFIEKLQTLHPQQQTICDEKYVPSREMILAIWELGNEWKENPTGVTQREYIQKHWKESSYYDKLKSTNPQPHTVSIKDATKFGNLEYERGVKDGIQHEKNHQWKPSDEQMEALKNSAYGTYQNGDGPALRELYNQLKRLM